MFYIDDSEFEKLIIHHIGNKNQGENVFLSENEIELDDEKKQVLLDYFFSSFKDEIFYQFSNESVLEDNIVFKSAGKIFENAENIIDESKNIATHLFEQSYHPQIKSGELYIAYFKNCIVEDEIANAVGIFKSETKDIFIKSEFKNENINISHDTGININKIDKACLIFNTEKETGYKIAMIDVAGRSKEAGYWKDDFLNLELRKDDYYQTKNYIGICKGFVSDIFNPANGVERADQIEMMNKTSEFFNEKNTFDLNEFSSQVIGNEEVIDAFNEYKNKVADANDLEIKDNFDISQTAVKKSKAQFKSVLKLDKNFHIYIHGDRQRIVKGFDTKTGLNFYQVFYEKED
ncbi:MAG: nucleoid-associated protein [Bacteroidales bacterium]|nr:nucleoid-associated protein [Bacteroidales bacterium]MBN2756736.1 nucleoid-associated protein [Bacteroidales bacterium]